MNKCQFKLLILVIIPVVFGIDNFSTKTLKDSCGNNYENVDGVHITNQEQDWKSSSNKSQINNCNIIIKQTSLSNNSSTNNQEQYLFIKFDNSNLCSNENYNKLAISIQSNNQQIVQDNLCKLFNQTNYLLVNSSSSVNISLIDNNINVNYPFQAFEHLIITAFLYANNSGYCSDGFFKCQSPSTVCLNNKFKCDNVKSCSDGSDELNCQVVSTTPISSTSLSSSQTLTTSQMNDTNSTTPLIENANKHLNKFNFLIAAVVILSVVIIVLGAIWLYGRRKRRWREFLAQLDNNTDWEYEQLDDGPAISASRTTMTPIFNLNVTNDYGGGNNTSLRENTNTNLMSSSINSNNTPASNSNTNRSNINERTPITVPS